MSDRDIDELFRRFADLDRELKELKLEVGEIKSTLESEEKEDYSTYQLNTDFMHDKPAQWPNELYTDYLKRIGEYNEAQVYEDDTK